MTAKNDSGSVAKAEDTGWKQLTKIARWQQSIYMVLFPKKEVPR